MPSHSPVLLLLLVLSVSGVTFASVIVQHTPLLNELEPCVAENVKVLSLSLHLLYPFFSPLPSIKQAIKTAFASVAQETDHYICTDDHQVICLNGWTDPTNRCNKQNPYPPTHNMHVSDEKISPLLSSTSCRTPVCEFLAHDQADSDGDGDTGEITAKTCAHGECVRPGTCACEVGWEGVACDECIRMPGCREGYCQEAFQCICHDEEQWTGALCDCRERRGEGQG